MYLTKAVDVDIDIDADDIVSELNEKEKRELAAKLLESPADPDLRSWFDRLRAYSQTGDARAFLKCVEDMAWSWGDRIIDTSRILRVVDHA